MQAAGLSQNKKEVPAASRLAKHMSIRPIKNNDGRPMPAASENKKEVPVMARLARHMSMRLPNQKESQPPASAPSKGEKIQNSLHKAQSKAADLSRKTFQFVRKESQKLTNRKNIEEKPPLQNRPKGAEEVKSGNTKKNKKKKKHRSSDPSAVEKEMAKAAEALNGQNSAAAIREEPIFSPQLKKVPENIKRQSMGSLEDALLFSPMIDKIKMEDHSDSTDILGDEWVLSNPYDFEEFNTAKKLTKSVSDSNFRRTSSNKSKTWPLLEKQRSEIFNPKSFCEHITNSMHSRRLSMEGKRIFSSDTESGHKNTAANSI